MSSVTYPIELLAPARDAAIGIEAINHGADAVYIGAPKYGARVSAGNSIEEIATLARHAHMYGAKVLVAFNTILTDAELAEAESLIHRIYEAGADALIIQDMGLLKLDLPPIRLHASTQADNRSPERVRFLQEVGFSRVVLARELGLQQIRDIRAHTDVELEAFVHGALCVSYSGQCYLSQALCGRSANRGACAQLCRLPYDLIDSNGKIWQQNKHLLSLKDMDRSDHLLELMEAGITSFKIEGRLKDASYVKNIVAYYRCRLDALLEQDNPYRQASYGKVRFFFEPDPNKTFRRGATDYFLYGRTSDMAQWDTPKSTGEQVGSIRSVKGNTLRASLQKSLANGDGLCYVSTEGFTGFRVNNVEDGRIMAQNRLPEAAAGTMLYRNVDYRFERLLEQKTAERRLPVTFRLTKTDGGFELTLTEIERGTSTTVSIECEKVEAHNQARMHETIITQVSKLGDTPFEAIKVECSTASCYFLPVAVLNDARRRAVAGLIDLLHADRRPAGRRVGHGALFPEQQLTYAHNIANKKAEQFYREHGVTGVVLAFELEQVDDAHLMTCKYCIRHEMGLCPKAHNPSVQPVYPLYLVSGSNRLQLHFDCKRCEMYITR